MKMIKILQTVGLFSILIIAMSCRSSRPVYEGRYPPREYPSSPPPPPPVYYPNSQSLLLVRLKKFMVADQQDLMLRDKEKNTETLIVVIL